MLKNTKLFELKKAMGETKVLLKMKEKELEKYNKVVTKKEQMEIEEQFIMSNVNSSTGEVK